ncbi:MAG: hypothetical protein AB1696_16415 [Planctomycetota bacterium]
MSDLKKTLLKTGIFCGAFYTFDVLFLSMPCFGVLAIGLLFLAGGIYALLSLRKNERELARAYAVQSLLGLVTLVAIFGTFHVNRWIGHRNATPIIAAVKQYKELHGEYPVRLEDLVPEFLDKAPRCVRVDLLRGRYGYFYDAEHKWAELVYFWSYGQRDGYDFRRDEWRELMGL